MIFSISAWLQYVLMNDDRFMQVLKYSEMRFKHFYEVLWEDVLFLFTRKFVMLWLRFFARTDVNNQIGSWTISAVDKT